MFSPIRVAGRKNKIFLLFIYTESSSNVTSASTTAQSMHQQVSAAVAAACTTKASANDKLNDLDGALVTPVPSSRTRSLLGKRHHDEVADSDAMNEEPAAKAQCNPAANRGKTKKKYTQ